ncbi:hypothetical protein HHK36_024106 [Tetracentron sinense]|uniref:cytokinin dehydrogenase n=1 Tax=Tetracentron sinense TaxID=13715 RepID=A0A834YIW5_TETSI|nr:hypothetical protein HHK36_024106 [Tetracentron sinense]
MEFALFCTRINFLVLLVALSSPCKFIQSPMDLGPLNLLQTTNSASLDFGRIYFNSPSAVLRPQSPKEISLLLSFLSASSFSKITVAAKGAGHSVHGQAQALNGIVIEMESLSSSIKIHRRRDLESTPSYADVSGGTLWVELLKESLKYGLAPRSWTDYLYLSIGGTLSNGGISGQTFKYGPQISNVHQLDVVTGTGELVTCSPIKNPELFYAVLGGLGQFGIITSARILLQEAPQKVVKWVRAFYDDFEVFIKDQEMLILMEDMVDYVEGFMVLNEGSLHSSFIAFPANLGSLPQFQPGTSHVYYYCIEFAVYDQPDKHANLDHVVDEISRKLSFMPSLIYSVEVSYFDFLNRVKMEEMNLRGRGLWDVFHPWLNMFVPKSGITQFKDLLLDNISPMLTKMLPSKYSDKQTVIATPSIVLMVECKYIRGTARIHSWRECIIHSGDAPIGEPKKLFSAMSPRLSPAKPSDNGDGDQSGNQNWRKTVSVPLHSGRAVAGSFWWEMATVYGAKVVDEISRKLSFMPSLIYSVEVSYFDFLNRVKMEEMNLRGRGLWDVSHPWLNMFVPKSGITQFKDLLLDNISREGPILIYPILRDKWNANTSAILPESIVGENVLYTVGMLRLANPRSCSQQCVQDFLWQNRQITATATDTATRIGAKQYLSHYTREEQWWDHFGGKWQQFMKRKSAFDPLNILAPGQAIFKRKCSINPYSPLTLTSQ